jgi:hypothetical protein
MRPKMRPAVPRELDHESKFLLPSSAAEAARVLLRGVARPERPHAAGLVQTIYLDDARLSSFEEKRASEFLKTKFRVRWYDGTGAVFLECKQRVGSRRRKQRTRLPLAAETLTRDGVKALEGLSLAAHSAALGVAVAAELRPTLYLRYRRERFVTPTGERLCLDSEIESLAVAARLGGRRGPVRLGTAVFEIKGAGRELPATCAALATLGARRGSFSKYFACLAALTQ